MKKIYNRGFILLISLIIILLNLGNNIMYLITYEKTWGIPVFGGNSLYDIAIYDYLLGPNIYNFEIGYPIKFIKLKILVFSIALLAAILFYLGKKVGKLILTICFSMYLLFLIFLLEDLFSRMMGFYLPHFLIIVVYNFLLLIGAGYVVYALNWAKGDKTITT